VLPLFCHFSFSAVRSLFSRWGICVWYNFRFRRLSICSFCNRFAFLSFPQFIVVFWHGPIVSSFSILVQCRVLLMYDHNDESCSQQLTFLRDCLERAA
jgi:hypothetical protein